MFTIKVFRGGTNSPSSVEFYACDTPVAHAEDMDDTGGKSSIEVAVNGFCEFVTLRGNDVAFIENSEGVTVHSMR